MHFVCMYLQNTGNQISAAQYDGHSTTGTRLFGIGCVLFTSFALVHFFCKDTISFLLKEGNRERAYYLPTLQERALYHPMEESYTRLVLGCQDLVVHICSFLPAHLKLLCVNRLDKCWYRACLSPAAWYSMDAKLQRDPRERPLFSKGLPQQVAQYLGDRWMHLRSLEWSRPLSGEFPALLSLTLRYQEEECSIVAPELRRLTLGSSRLDLSAFSKLTDLRVTDIWCLQDYTLGSVTALDLSVAGYRRERVQDSHYMAHLMAKRFPSLTNLTLSGAVAGVYISDLCGIGDQLRRLALHDSIDELHLLPQYCTQLESLVMEEYTWRTIAALLQTLQQSMPTVRHLQLTTTVLSACDAESWICIAKSFPNLVSLRYDYSAGTPLWSPIEQYQECNLPCLEQLDVIRAQPPAYRAADGLYTAEEATRISEIVAYIAPRLSRFTLPIVLCSCI